MDVESLKDILAQDELSRAEKLLLLLSVDNASPKKVAEVRVMALSCGLRKIKTWNISSILAAASSDAISCDGKWELTSNGKKIVSHIVRKYFGGEEKVVAVDLRAHLPSISDPHTAAFLSEAVSCLERGYLRAAVVLTWVGSISLLYRHVLHQALGAFNAEAFRRDSRWKTAKTEDDLALMKEYEFLNVLQAISIVGKSVKIELQECLNLRNACGHPNSYKLGGRRVAAHVEVLILNVFKRF